MPAKAGDTGDVGLIPGWEDPLEEDYSNILAWRIPWIEEPGRLQSIGLQRVGHDWMNNTFTFHFLLYIYVLSALSIHLLMDTWVASISWQLWIMLLSTLWCMYLFELVFFFFPDIYPGVELMGHMVALFLRSTHTTFRSGCTNLHSYWQCRGVHLASYPQQHLLFGSFFQKRIMAILTGVRWFLQFYSSSLGPFVCPYRF